MGDERRAGASVSWGRGAPPGRLQPLLPIGFLATIAPALVTARATGLLALLTAVVVVWLVTLRWLTARPGIAPQLYPRMLVAFVLVAIAALLGAILTDQLRAPESYVLLGAGLIAVMAPVRPAVVRSALQASTVAVFVAALVVDGRRWQDVVFVAVVLGTLAVLVDLVATELSDAGRAHGQALADAARLNELLEAVRQLPTDEPQRAAEAAVASLQGLGYDGAAVAMVRGEQLVFVARAAVEPLPPLPRGHGLSWLAIEERRTIAVGDYQHADRRLPWRPDIHAVVIAPIVVEGDPIGVLTGTRPVPRSPTAAEVEVAEVLAAQLGGVFETVRRERRQRELLERLRRLEHLRSGFVGAVSAELREPLAEIRTASRDLSRGDGIADEDRRRLLDRLTNRADDLRHTIEAILDLSRFQARREEAVRRPVRVVDLLGDLVEAVGSELRWDAAASETVEVDVDRDLARHALGLLIRAGMHPDTDEQRAEVVRVRVSGDRLVLDIDRDHRGPSAVARSLASQLLLAGGGELTDQHPLRVTLPVAEHDGVGACAGVPPEGGA